MHILSLDCKEKVDFNVLSIKNRLPDLATRMLSSGISTKY